MTQAASIEPPRGNITDHDYDALRARISKRFTDVMAAGQALFTTNAEGLWEAYLEAFPPESRQYHNCSACRHFIQRFGNLVSIDEKGLTEPVAWNEQDSDPLHLASISAMARIVRRAKVTGVFLSKYEVLGQPVTGAWTHFYAELPAAALYRGLTLTAGQAMAEKREDFKNVSRALGEFGPELIEEAFRVLNADALYRSEKVLGPATFLRDLHEVINAGANRANVIWRAIAKAPAGFCHPRASMVGTLLEDIEKGLGFEEVSRRFREKMHPLQYQRPQAAPSAGTIAQAEKIIAQLGAAGALDRRFARVDEIVALWRPATPKDAAQHVGVFGHLKAKGAAPSPSLVVPAAAITWEKFARTVLPEAASIDIMVPHRGNFVALLTAANPEAPPILQWDNPERRNPFSLYVYHGGSSATQWGLSAMAWAKVTAVTLRPSQWHGGHEHQGKGAIFVIAGAVDSRDSGNALFPETLNGELHGIRSVIEAYSRSAKIAGREQASACGLMFEGAYVRVKDASGGAIEYRIDRWD